MTYDLKEFFSLQKGLDSDIHARHNTNYQETYRKRILAYLIELGECCNEIRCFKFWSLKGPSPKEVILEEYIDGLHFILSLGIHANYDINKPLEVHDFKDKDLSDALLEVYEKGANLSKEFNITNYVEAFSYFLGVSRMLNYTFEDLHDAYLKKLAINYQRQENKY